jgi:hypothetical protein
MVGRAAPGKGTRKAQHKRIINRKDIFTINGRSRFALGITHKTNVTQRQKDANEAKNPTIPLRLCDKKPINLFALKT